MRDHVEMVGAGGRQQLIDPWLDLRSASLDIGAAVGRSDDVFGVDRLGVFVDVLFEAVPGAAARTSR